MRIPWCAHHELHAGGLGAGCTAGAESGQPGAQVGGGGQDAELRVSGAYVGGRGHGPEGPSFQGFAPCL